MEGKSILLNNQFKLLEAKIYKDHLYFLENYVNIGDSTILNEVRAYDNNTHKLIPQYSDFLEIYIPDTIIRNQNFKIKIIYHYRPCNYIFNQLILSAELNDNFDNINKAKLDTFVTKSYQDKGVFDISANLNKLGINQLSGFIYSEKYFREKNTKEELIKNKVYFRKKVFVK